MRKTLVLVFGLALMAEACSSDSDNNSDAGDGGTEEDVVDSGDTDVIPAGTIQGTVTYEGSETGSLTVGIFTDCPPAGPPAGMVYQQIAEPSFPQNYELTGASAGDYYVVAILDVAPASPMTPGPEDKMSCSDQFTLGTDSGASVDVTLTD